MENTEPVAIFEATATAGTRIPGEEAAVVANDGWRANAGEKNDMNPVGFEGDVVADFAGLTERHLILSIALDIRYCRVAHCQSLTETASREGWTVGVDSAAAAIDFDVGMCSYAMTPASSADVIVAAEMLEQESPISCRVLMFADHHDQEWR